MKRDYGSMWAIALVLVCGVSVAGYVQADSGATRHFVSTAVSVNGALGATANTGAKTRAERLEQERRAAVADAYMAQLHRIAIGAGGGLLPSRPFALGMENYAGEAADVDANSSYSSYGHIR